MMKKCFFLLISGLLATSAIAGDIAKGKALAMQQCASCHAADGNSTIPSNPRLAGQYASYITQALRAYRDGGRNNPIMAGFAAGLSDEQIADLAAYFASQDSVLLTLPK